ncbi:glutathione ABC transporter substrate-binding protein [Oceanobacillus sp. FSL K6-2867]|uniref:glutathione ABC transporter substrate-binding protein n=1 Tax=Oceanobacillus sp. FSL K6-2867 TaxID=2954748 RepID=UPI0030DBBFAB
MFESLKKYSLLLVSIFFLAVILTACASEPEESSSSSKGGEETAGGKDLVISTASDAISLDPAGANDVPSFDVQNNIFERLVSYDQNMELQPGLAKSWEQIDETTWEFKLREGVTFHDGSEFNAEAVKANIERINDPEVAAPAAYLLDMISEVVVIDDYTVQFKTEFPYSGLPSNLSHSVSGMVSPEQIREDYAAMEEGESVGSVINANPIGTGFLKFDDWQPGQLIRLVKNEVYWEEPAKIDSVTFKVVPEDLTRIAELETGDTHISNPLSSSDVSQIEAKENLSVVQQGSLALDYLGFNTAKAPFDDKLVRQAITMAIDKNQIIDGIYEGYAQVAEGPLPPNVYGYDENVEGLSGDLDKAKELLSEAGFSDGFTTTLMTNDTRERMDIATNVQAQLAEIGITVEIEVLEWGTYIEKLDAGEQEMFILGWSNSTAHADNTFYPLFHSDNLGSAGNTVFFDDKEMNALIEEARQTQDQAEQLELYKQAEEMLVDLAPMTYLTHKDYLLGVRDEVKGLTMYPSKLLNLKEVSIEE